ncbi:putative Eukaryotic translation initiation factor 3 [Globisporangium polare]
MAAYNTPHVDVNGNGWGPTALPEQFLNVPYAPFNKGDKLGKAADFVSNYAPRNARYTRDPSGVNAEFQYKHDAVEDATFQLVDTAKGTKPKGNNDRLRPTWNQQRFGGRGGSFAARRFGPGAAGAPDANAPGGSSAQLRMKGQQKQNKRWDRLSNARRMFTGRRRDEQKVDRLATVKVEASWTILEQFELQQLTKLQANIPNVEDIKWCGSLNEYDNAFDRITSKSNLRVQRYDDRDFYYVTTTDDPVIEELATKGEANVFATDAILAHLMASSRSVFPWDIVVQRVNNMVFFDKRDQSAFDLVSVNENASEPPASDDPDSINHPDRLSLEATMINQNLSQQMMKATANKKDFAEPNPFASDDSTPATYAYRYRKFELGNGLNLVTRCEVHGISHKKEADQYVAAFALNEYDPKLAGSIEWRKKIDSQRGAILANELKNNSCKLARWTAQALLGGIDEMKLGYVSRVNTKDPYSHVVLGTQSYNPHTFANQIALNQNNMWGVVKMLAELMLEQPEGKYVLMKDPNKPVVRLYSVPQDTFDEEDDEENEA